MLVFLETKFVNVKLLLSDESGERDQFEISGKIKNGWDERLT